MPGESNLEHTRLDENDTACLQDVTDSTDVIDNENVNATFWLLDWWAMTAIIRWGNLQYLLFFGHF